MRKRMRGEDHPLKTVAHVCSQTPQGEQPRIKGGHVISLCINDEIEFQSNFTLQVRLL